MRGSAIGLRIRETRKKIGLRQTDLAKRIGVSASYLNLIEAEKRRINGDLLRRIADQLGVSDSSLTGRDEERLVETLAEMIADPAVNDAGAIPFQEIEDIVARYPKWGRLVARVYRRMTEM
ncbi:MAG: helix-turn-helix transcriptional regulator, partial [Pseudomonadota bacterium]